MIPSMIEKFTIKTIVSFALALLVAMGTGITLAQTSADKQYVQDLVKNLDSLKREADSYYNKNVKPLEDALKNIAAKDPNDEKNRKDLVAFRNEESKIRQEIATSSNNINSKTAELNSLKGAKFDKDVEKFVIDLLNARCNPKAIASLNDCKELLSKEKRKALATDIDVLNKYENFCDEMHNVLESFQHRFNRSKWKKLEEDSPLLQEFDNAWTNVTYHDRYNKDGDIILFLDECYKKALDMKKRGLGNCEKEYEQLLQNLTPDYQKSISSPISHIKNLEDEIEQEVAKKNNAEKELKTIVSNISRLEASINKNAKNDKDYNDLEKKRYNETEKWYDIREEIDKRLTKACLDCLKQPCDTLGNNEWLRKQVKELTDTTGKYPQFKSYKSRFAEYHKLFDNYNNYSWEIGEFLKDNYKYNRGDGELTAKMHSEIDAGLKNLTYYKKYYLKRNEKNAIHSENLDYIIKEFEDMFQINFKGCKERYKKLNSRVPRKKTAKSKTPKASEEPINNDRQ